MSTASRTRWPASESGSASAARRPLAVASSRAASCKARARQPTHLPSRRPSARSRPSRNSTQRARGWRRRSSGDHAAVVCGE
ncbi:MAG: hypothetical protein ACK55I_29475 [bacterium]